MAQGDMTLFDDFKDYMGDATFDFQSGGDQFKVGMITDAVVATAADAAPEFADYTEVSGGTSYTAGGEVVANQDWSYSAGDAYYIGDDTNWVYDASGPTNCYQAILYHVSSDKAICFVDLTPDGGSTPLSLQDGPILIAWGGASLPGKLFKAA